MKKRARMYDVLDFIVRYADENAGVTTSTRTIAAGLGLSQPRVQYLMTRLIAARFIEFVDREKYKVCDSEWEAPPYLPL